MMRLFKRKTPEEKEAKIIKEFQEFSDAYELVVQKLSAKYRLSELDEKDFIVIREMLADFASMESYERKGTAESRYLSLLVRQNFMIIRKLDEISKKLK